MQQLKIEVIRADRLAPELRASILELCRRAYEEDLQPLFATFADATHVLGFLGDPLVGSKLVSHAMWVTRWLQPGEGPLLRTAYVEMVATEPGQQRQGFASAVMRRLASRISDYDLGALCPAEPELYARLGWIFWRGPLFIRSDQGLIPQPDEQVMIYRLPNTPALNLDLPLSAEWREGELY